MKYLVVKKIPEFFLHFTPKMAKGMTFIFRHCILIKLFFQRVLFHAPFSQEVLLSNIIPKSVVTLHFLKCLIFQITAYIQGFQMRYKSFFSMINLNFLQWRNNQQDFFFFVDTVVIRTNRMWKCTNRKTSCSSLDTNDPKMIDISFESPKCRL